MARRLVNLSRHPVTDAQCSQLAELIGADVSDIEVNEPSDDTRALLHLDLDAPLEPQVVQLIAATGVTREAWNGDAIYFIPPDLSPVAAVALTVVHGIAGFPQLVLRARDPSGEGFAIIGTLDLPAIRDRARQASL